MSCVGEAAVGGLPGVCTFRPTRRACVTPVGTFVNQKPREAADPLLVTAASNGVVEEATLGTPLEAVPTTFETDVGPKHTYALAHGVPAEADPLTVVKVDWSAGASR